MNEPKLSTLIQIAITIAVFATLLFAAFIPLIALAQQSPEQLQPEFGTVLIAIRNAEAAGATSRELSPLVAKLNNALAWKQIATSLNGVQNANRKAQVLARINQTLTIVQNQADQVKATASARGYFFGVYAYSTGAIAAVFGTFAYAIGAAIYREYKIKRVFGMKVTPK